MSTEPAKTLPTPSSYEDLRAAIEAASLVTLKNGVRIVGSEHGEVVPWLFDLRALMLQPKWLDRYAKIFWERYAERLPFQVGGVETAGIPLVAAIVMKSVERGTPVNGFYIRKSRKRHGLMKYIEGTLTDEPVVFVDDLINSGQSVRKQVDILADARARISDVFVLLAFREETEYSFLKEKGIRLSHLFALPDFGVPLRAPRAEPRNEAFEVLWRYKGPLPSFDIVLQKSAPASDEKYIFFGRDDGVFVALDQKSGKLVWEFPIGKHPPGKGILSSPALHAGRVYFGAYDGSVYALDAETGALSWRSDDADWVGSSPDVAPDLGLLYIGLEYGLVGKRGGIAALDIKTGTRVWHAYHTGLTHGSPLYVPEESLVVIGSNDHILYAYDAKTGALRWRCASRGDIKTKAAYDAKRGAIIFASMDGNMYAVAAKDGMPLHVRETGAAIYSIPLVHEDTIYVASLDKCLYAIDCNTWKDKWVFETSGRIFASPVIHDGSLWIGSNDGKLYEIDPKNGNQKSFFQATERIVNRVAYNDDLLFVPTVANELYCISKKKDKSVV